MNLIMNPVNQCSKLIYEQRKLVITLKKKGVEDCCAKKKSLED